MQITLSQELRLEQKLLPRPHSPIKNPEITKEAKRIEGNLDDVLCKGRLSPYDKMLHTEAYLLSRWAYKDEYDQYLDSPLIAHVDAALRLRDFYDCVVAIQNAGLPYAKIFEMVGYDAFEVDYSHHKRKMRKPRIKNEHIDMLRDKKSILLTDIDFVTGKTLRVVTNYLRENSVNVKGAYIGLSRWRGLDTGEFFIGARRVNFETFWKCKTTGLSFLGSRLPYRMGLIPNDLRAYAPNPSLEDKIAKGSAIAREIATYFKDQMAKKEE